MKCCCNMAFFSISRLNYLPTFIVHQEMFLLVFFMYFAATTIIAAASYNSQCTGRQNGHEKQFPHSLRFIFSFHFFCSCHIHNSTILSSFLYFKCTQYTMFGRTMLLSFNLSFHSLSPLNIKLVNLQSQEFLLPAFHLNSSNNQL